MAKKLKIVIGVCVIDEDKELTKDALFATLGLVYENGNTAVLQTLWESLQNPEVLAGLQAGFMPLMGKLTDVGWELNMDDPKVAAVAEKVRGHRGKPDQPPGQGR